MDKVDFSILNNTDIFYVECSDKQKWVVTGCFLERMPKSKGVYLDDEHFFTNNKLCEKEDVEKLRKAIEEELEVFYKIFPEEKPKGFRRSKSKSNSNSTNHLTIKDMQEAGWKFKYIK